MENLLTLEGKPFRFTNENGYTQTVAVYYCRCGNYKLLNVETVGRDRFSCGCLKSRRKRQTKIKLEKYKEVIIELYTVQKLSTEEISQKYNCTRTYISKFLRDNNISLEKRRAGKYNKCWTGYKDLSGKYWAIITCSARLRKLKFDVDRKYLYDLFEQQNRRCALTNLPLTLGRLEEQTASLDRIDSLQGYVKGNVQWVSKEVNIMKNKFGQDYFVNICKLVAEHDRLTNLTVIPS